ncbi:hypothetical protein FJY69_06635, partial [candidate division WOR-3 bacterium]|nr:hypothetical protein [candidate division WOR-3 bacterium]
TAWLRSFNPGSGLDGATALAVDRTGNVIATGYVGGPSSQHGDWVTIKYSAAGESLWATVTDIGEEDRPSCVVVDSAGDSYVTGRAGSLNYFDMSAVKYDPAGNEVWFFNYDGGQNDMGIALAVDGQGNTYMTGFSQAGGRGDLMTWKLGRGGESLWATVYAGPAGHDDRGTAVAVDGSGNVIVAGTSQDTASAEDYIIIKHGPTGDTLWTRRYNGPGNRSDQVAGLALDPAGNVYVTGTSDVDAQGHYNYATIKYSSSGEQGWVKRYIGPRHYDRACGLALDAEANAYVAGSSVNSNGQWDVVTIKYDSAGNEKWTERFNMPSMYDEAYVLALSRQGTVYVGGRTDIENQGIDYLTLAYGTAGAVTERTPSAELRAPSAGPTIVRRVLFLPRDMGPGTRSELPGRNSVMSRPALLDIGGRKVLDLKPGANDVSRLAPGVYFVREEGSRVQGAKGSRVRKVVVAR